MAAVVIVARVVVVIMAVVVPNECERKILNEQFHLGLQSWSSVVPLTHQ